MQCESDSTNPHPTVGSNFLISETVSVRETWPRQSLFASKNVTDTVCIRKAIGSTVSEQWTEK